MNEVIIYEDSSIEIETINMITTTVPFYHVDRISPFNIMIYVLEGCIYVTEDDEDYSVKKGEILFLKQGCHQTGKYEVRAGTSWIYVHFYIHDTRATKSTKIAKSLRSDVKLNESSNIILPKKTSHMENTNFDRVIRQILSQYQSEDFLQRKRANLNFSLSLVDLYEDSVRGEKHTLSDDIILYLESNVQEMISSKDLEDYFHLSYKYMVRVFKKQTGYAIMQYHTRMKMQYAARLLHQTNKSVAEIGQDCGIDDALYFSRCFKKVMGESPSGYRKHIVY